MTLIEEALPAHLIADAGVSAIVGDRIYPVELPQQVTFPAVTYQRISSQRTYSHSGDSQLPHPTFQFSAWGKTYGDARRVANAVIASLGGFNGTMSGLKVNIPEVGNDVDLRDPDVDLFHIPVDFDVWYQAAGV